MHVPDLSPDPCLCEAQLVNRHGLSSQAGDDQLWSSAGLGRYEIGAVLSRGGDEVIDLAMMQADSLMTITEIQEGTK